MVAHLRADFAALLVAALLAACAAGAEAAGTNFCDIQGDLQGQDVPWANEPSKTWYDILQCPRLQLFSRSLAHACVPSDVHDFLFWEDNCTKMSP